MGRYRPKDSIAMLSLGHDPTGPPVRRQRHRRTNRERADKGTPKLQPNATALGPGHGIHDLPDAILRLAKGTKAKAKQNV